MKTPARLTAVLAVLAVVGGSFVAAESGIFKSDSQKAIDDLKAATEELKYINDHGTPGEKKRAIAALTKAPKVNNRSWREMYESGTPSEKARAAKMLGLKNPNLIGPKNPKPSAVSSGAQLSRICENSWRTLGMSPYNSEIKADTYKVDMYRVTTYAFDSSGFKRALVCLIDKNGVLHN